MTTNQNPGNHEIDRLSSRRRVPRPLLVLTLVGSLVAVLTFVVVRFEVESAALLDPTKYLDGSAAEQPAPPPSGGYFETLPAGVWKELPGDEECAERVRHSDWEPRPSNRRANNTMPDPEAVGAAFEARPRGAHGSYDERWNTWLLPRVSGQHTGTTDENIQWAACKWGLSDNLLRAIAAAESTWFHHAVDPSTGLCVNTRGCGDYFTEATPDSRTFCREISRYGLDYTKDYPQGLCPKTFAIVAVMSWQDPDWGPMLHNQNGTFPFNRDSTAFALDYIGGFLRGCQDGWLRWLSNTGTGDYKPGDIWGCVGTWYAGSWKVPAAKEYAGRVRELMDERVWLDPHWGEEYHEPYGS